MHFNIWVNDSLINDLEAIMRIEGKKRNAVITDAIREYVKKRQVNTWPEEIQNFNGIEGLEGWSGFEAERSNLKELPNNLFG